MQTTTVEELVSKGFMEDPQGLKQLERPFALPLALGVGGFALSFALMMLEKISTRSGFVLAGVSWCFVVAMMVCMYRSRPKSRHTGRPMVKYKNRSPASGVIHEVIYVCPESKTFWRRIYLENGDG
jgi:hypothetical protein